MYCDAKEIRFRNREEFTLKSKAKTFLIDILLDIVGGCFIAIGVYNFAVASGFPVAGISGIAIVFYYFWKIPIGTMTTILNIPIILICYKLLGKQFFLRSIKTMLIFPTEICGFALCIAIKTKSAPPVEVSLM